MIKSLKLDILAAIADESNAFDIATELTEYVNDIDEQLARDAVRAVGRIAIEVRAAWTLPRFADTAILASNTARWPSIWQYWPATLQHDQPR